MKNANVSKIRVVTGVVAISVAVPVALDSLVWNLMQKRPEDRPPNALEVQRQLELLRGGATVDPVGDNGELLTRNTLLLGRLVYRELAADDDALDSTHHAALD